MEEGDGAPSGRPGVSARAEYLRRRSADETRRRDRFGPLAPIVGLLAGPRASTEAWERGAEGEELVGRVLDARGRLLGVGPPRPVGAGDAGQHRPPRRRPVRCLGGRLQALPRQDRAAPLGRARPEVGPLRGRARRRSRSWMRPSASAPGSSAHSPEACRCGPRCALPALAGRRGPGLSRFRGVLVTWPAALGRTLRAPGPLGRGRTGAARGPTVAVIPALWCVERTTAAGAGAGATVRAEATLSPALRA